MKVVIDRRLVYGGEDFVEEMAAAHKIPERMKQIGRRRGWRKYKENRLL